MTGRCNRYVGRKPITYRDMIEWFWLRSPNPDNNNELNADPSGGNVNNNNVNNNNGGVRPALS